jgi:hypothetical protein
MAKCISDNPVDKNDPEGLRRVAIWRWAIRPYASDPVTRKLTGGGISEGRSYEDVAESIREHFFGGTKGRTDLWIADILSGRKTPFKPFVEKTWAAQRNRRAMVGVAKAQTENIQREQHLGPVLSKLNKALEFPREVSTWRHALPLAQTHPGDLAFQPHNMGIYWSNLLNTIKYAHPFQTYEGRVRGDAIIEQMTNRIMKLSDNYDMALRSKLRVGEQSRLDNIGSSKVGSDNERAWQLIKIARFKLWEKEYLKAIKPGMSEEEKLEHGMAIADMANHATGTSTGSELGTGIPKQLRGAFFGPALTESKLSRTIGDPLKTGFTFARMLSGGETTPANRYIAWRRLSRASQYLGTLTGFLAVNWGFNKYAQHVDDKDNVNFFNPTKSDWMSFKTNGVEWAVPGLHTELKFLGVLLVVAYQSALDVTHINKVSHGLGQWGEVGQALGQYTMNKMVPGGQIALEGILGHNWQGRPLAFEPWVGKGNAKHPALSWHEWMASHLPIPLTGPIGVIYADMRAQGASAKNSTDMIKALIWSGVQALPQLGMGMMGLHAKPDPAAEKRAAAAKSFGH